MQKLVNRLRERVQDIDRAIGMPPARISPPVTVRGVAAAERKLGFPLPELLRAIYTQIGNGGFGPSYGFLGLRGGATDEKGDTLVGVYECMQSVAQENSYWHWPDGLLPLCRLGCGMYSCLDCARARTPVLVFDPNNLNKKETDKLEAVIRWTNAFWHERNSFASWLEGWLDDRPHGEPTWPSGSWLRQRLWQDEPANVRIFLEA